MINTIKWAIYYRTLKDKERSQKIFDLIWKKLDCDKWGSEWSEEQEDLFYEQIDLLLPVKDVEHIQEVYDLVKSVFGDVRLVN